NDGIADGTPDLNGVPSSASGGITPIDTLSDGIYDFQNTDSDGDGCSDANEAYGDANADGGDGGQYGAGTPTTINPANGIVITQTGIDYTTGTNAAVTDGDFTLSVCYVDPCDPIASGNTDTDNDNISDVCDVDDDNDGILDSVECNLSEVDFGSLGTAVGTRLDPGDPDATFTNYVTGDPLNRTITVSAPIAANGSPTNFFVGSESNNILRFEDNSGHTSGTSYQSLISFNLPSIPYFTAGAVLGQSNINQWDSLTFTAVNESPTANVWAVVSSSDADITVNGNSITISGGASAGSAGSGPFVEFQIVSNVALDEVLVEHTNLASGPSINSGRFSVQLCEDTDGDGVQDTLDLDSDNDGIYDVDEVGGTDANNDGLADGTVSASGVPATAGAGITPIDTLGDGSFDFQNTDSDGDGCSDANEAYNDGEADGNDGGQFGAIDPATVNLSNGLVTETGINYLLGTNTAVTDSSDSSSCLIELTVTKTITTSGSALNDVIAYDIIVTNTGNVTVTDIEITDAN
ncbi:hypothetical protein HNV10_17070, partial [Winogradskyella litoriviva]